MNKKLIALLIAGTMLMSPIAVYADEKDDRIAELEAQVAEMQATIDNLTAQLESTKSTNQDEYKIGDTWTVEGQWKITITSVEESTDRNEYADKTPAAVYIVNYTYENLGYEFDGMNGLFIDFSDGIIDASGQMGYSYPGEIVNYPQETPVGAKCEAQSCIGVDNPGSFKIHFSTYDGNGQEQKTVFSIDV